MKIFNVFFGKSLGGIERAYINYGCMLSGFENVDSLNISHPKAAVYQELLDNQLPTQTISNLGKWDIYSVWRIRKLIKSHKPDMVICHGNRALSFFKKAAKGLCPVVGVAHNYKLKHFKNADHVIAVTQGIKEALISRGVDADKVTVIPNAIDIAKAPIKRQEQKVLTIGSVGRFVPEKAYDTFLHALKILKEKGVSFKAILAGDGPLKAELANLAEELELTNNVHMPGWVDSSKGFYQDIDIFCLSSRQEAFGIVLLEAMVNKVPIVSTKAAGPLEILTNHQTALMAEIDKPQSLATALQLALENSDLRNKLSANSYHFVEQNYSYRVVEKQIKELIDLLM